MMSAMLAMPGHSDDGELDPGLLSRCQAGEQAALRLFVEHYQRAVFALLSRVLGQRPEVEDLAQETFLRAIVALPGFAPAGPARLSTWLLTIATRLALDVCRKRGRERWSPLWRPFEKPLDAPSQRFAVTVLKNLYAFWVDKNYVMGNPWTGVTVPRSSKPRINTGRSLRSAARRIASSALWPSRASCSVTEMSTRPFKTATPNSAMKPTPAEMENGMSRSHSATAPPTP